MAITVAVISGLDFNLAPGLKVKGIRVTMDGSYAGSGGEACDLSGYFPNKVYGAAKISDDDGWSLSFEPAATKGSASGKVLSRNVTSTLDKALLPETDAAENLTGVVCDFLAIGN